MNFGELIAKGGALFARKGADALADTLETAPSADLARIQAAVSGYAGVITRQLARMGRVRQTIGVVGNSISADPLRWWELAALKSGGKLIVTKNAAIPGNTTGQIKNRLAADWPAGTGDIAFVQEGTNDYGPAVLPAVSYAQHAINMRAIYSHLLSVGTLPIGVFPPTRDSSPTGMARMGLVDYVVAREFGLPFIFPWRQFVRPDTGAFTASAQPVETPGVHPGRAAHALAAADAWAQIQDGGFPALQPLSNPDGAGQRTSNCLFLTDTNSDGLADGIVSYGDASVVNSLVAGVGDTLGRWQVMLGNGTGLHIWEYPIPVAGVQAGDVLLLSVRLIVEMLAANAQCSVSIRQYAGPSEFATNITPSGNAIAVAESLVAKEFVAIAGLTAINFVVTTNVASARCSIAQLQVYNLTGATR